MNTTCQFGYVALDMLNCTQNDCGEYTCEIRNESGAVHSSAQLMVQARRELETEFSQSRQYQQLEVKTVVQEVKAEEPPIERPVFVKHLSDQADKMEGSNLHFEAQVNPISDHTMKIEWSKDGAPITASSRIGTIFSFGYVSLNITGLRAEDAGVYTCRAFNAAGEAISQAKVSVTITQDLTASTGIVEQQQYIQKVQQLEQYQAAKTTLNRTESIVEPTQAPDFKTPIKDQLEIREGGFAHFEARLEPMGDHSMKVEWFKDGKPVDASSRITTFFNFGYVALTIKQVNAYDAGVYSCRASNKCGKAETTAKLKTISAGDPEFQSKTWESIQQMEASKTTVSSTQIIQEQTVQPRFLSQLKGTNVIVEGQRAHFECKLEPQNDPNLRVQWLLNGQEIKASSRIQTYYDFGYVAIDILDVSADDSGRYTLVATNALGSDQAHIDLRVEAQADRVDSSTIHAKTIEETKRFEMKQEVKQMTQEIAQSQSSPIFRTPLLNPQPVMEGQNIHLEARLEPIGDPTMKVEWFCNGAPLTIGSRFRTYNDFGFIALDIVGVTVHDQGTYVCRATNALGYAETNVVVEVVVKTNIVTESEHEAAMQQISYLESESKNQRLVTEEEAVKQAPTFTKTLKNVEITEGQNVHLEARLAPTGDSTMRVEWTVNGQPLKTGKKGQTYSTL